MIVSTCELSRLYIALPPSFISYNSDVFNKTCWSIYRLAVDKPTQFGTEKPYGMPFWRHAWYGRKTGLLRATSYSKIWQKIEIPACACSREIFSGSRPGTSWTFNITSRSSWWAGGHPIAWMLSGASCRYCASLEAISIALYHFSRKLSGFRNFVEITRILQDAQNIFKL